MATQCCESCAREARLPQTEWAQEEGHESSRVSVIDDLTPESLSKRLAESDALLIVWFYAPWCKQCKLVRPALEQAAKILEGRVEFGRVDCVAYPEMKTEHGVYSYPAFKAFRAGQSRWIELPKGRTVADLLTASRREAAGPYSIASTAAELRTGVFLQQTVLEVLYSVQQADEPNLFSGVGEAAVVANLPSLRPNQPVGSTSTVMGYGGATDGSAPLRTSAASNESLATANFGVLAASWSVRGSYLPFLATPASEAITAAGLPPIPPLHAAFLRLSPTSFQVVDVVPFSLVGEGGGVDIPTLASLLRAHRLPLHVDFYADPRWPKRAAQLTHIPAQLLLFVRPTQADTLIAEVSGAAERFERGAIIVFSFKVTDTDLETPNPLLKRYGINGVLDVPRLIVNLNRKGEATRRVPFEGPTIDESSVADVLSGLGLPMAHDAGPAGYSRLSGRPEDPKFEL